MIATNAGHSQKDCGEYFLYIGTYTGEGCDGIYACRFSPSRGTLTPAVLIAEATNPSFLALNPSKQCLYAVEEVNSVQEQSTGLVRAYSVDSHTGALTLQSKVVSHGSAPCHIAVDHTGTYAFVANYVGGTVAVFPILPDGALGEATAVVQHSDPFAREGESRRPHPHGAYISACNRFVLVPDLGLDKLFVYTLGDDGSLEPAADLAFEFPRGAGPRHVAWHRSLGALYVLNELNSTITGLEYDFSGRKLHSFQTISTLPDNYRGENSTAEIEIDQEGRFLYASNRGADTIAVFAIDDCGRLSAIEQTPVQGRSPRHFAIDPVGKYLLVANQDTKNIVVFSRNPATGELAPTGNEYKVGRPVCLVFAPVLA